MGPTDHIKEARYHFSYLKGNIRNTNMEPEGVVIIYNLPDKDGFYGSKKSKGGGFVPKELLNLRRFTHPIKIFFLV